MKNYTSKETLDALLSLNPLFRSRIGRPMELQFSHDLTITQFHTMVALCFATPMNMTQLAAQLGVSKQQLTKIIDGLVEKGFVRRFGDENNRRVVLVSITEAGLEMMQNTQTKFMDSVLPAFDRLNNEQRCKLVAAVQEIQQVLSSMEQES